MKKKSFREIFKEDLKRQDREEKERLSNIGLHLDHANPVHMSLASMIGSRIVAAGYVPGEPEGGLGFDYVKRGRTYRLVLGYNDLGTWVKYEGETQ